MINCYTRKDTCDSDKVVLVCIIIQSNLPLNSMHTSNTFVCFQCDEILLEVRARNGASSPAGKGGGEEGVETEGDSDLGHPGLIPAPKLNEGDGGDDGGEGRGGGGGENGKREVLPRSNFSERKSGGDKDEREEGIDEWKFLGDSFFLSPSPKRGGREGERESEKGERLGEVRWDGGAEGNELLSSLSATWRDELVENFLF